MDKKLTGLVFDAATGEAIEHELTVEELDLIKIGHNERQSIEAEQEARAKSRESALNKLAALGLTQKEIDAL
jgi:hypothetical protein